MILSDLIVKGLNEYGLLKNLNVKVQRFSGYTTKDLLYIVKPAAWRKPDAIIIYAGTNDIMPDINTMKNIKEIVKSIMDCSENMQVLFSGIVKGEEGNRNHKFSGIKARMTSYSEGRGRFYKLEHYRCYREITFE